MVPLFSDSRGCFASVSYFYANSGSEIDEKLK